MLAVLCFSFLSYLESFTKSVANAVIVDPLTAGSSRDLPNSDGHSTDGRIAATVTTTCLTSICFVIAAIFLSDRSDNDTAYLACLVILLAIVLIAIFAILWISVVAYLNTDTWYREVEREHTHGLKISITFLWVFGTASMVKEALELTVNFSCLYNPWETKTPGDEYRWIAIFSNLGTIAFYWIQLSFVSYFIRYRLGPYISINYGLLFTLMTNLVLWFISEKEEMEDYYDVSPDKAINRTQDPCFWTSNITKTVNSKLEVYLSPASIEFCLLSSGLILGMMPKHNNSNPMVVELLNSEEIVPILRPSERPVYRGNPLPHHPFTHFSFIILVIVVNLSLLTGNVVFVFVLPSNASMFCTWISIDTFYKLLMIIAIMLIYYHIHLYGEPDTGNHHLKPGQYILLIATTGTIAVCVFGMIGGIQILPLTRGYLYIIDNIIDIFIAFLQTVLLIHIERVHFDPSVSPGIPTDLLCIFLAICNIMYWIIDSFIDARYTESQHITGQIIDKDSWDDVQDLLAPMLIFYRFHAFLDWYIIYCKLRRM